jgi:putative PIN family toxin of toxin-antitoxin system
LRIVLDTNVVIAGVVADGLCRDLLKRRVLPHELFVSAELLDELAEVLRAKFGEDPDDVPFFGAYRERAHLVRPSALAEPVCRDPKDDFVLATARAARAHFIVTGDDDLLCLRTFEGTRIVSPRQFVELLDRGP